MYSERESGLIKPYLTKEARVLEYGSGLSSIEIANMVKSLLTIEHNRFWYEKIQPKLPDNTTIKLVFSTNYRGGTDGTYEQFKDYIETPEGIFDVILIDGRARIECAKYCKNIADENTIIFVHDYNRDEYKEIENYLELIEVVGTMAKFKLK